jgi:DNA-binding transcriptional ArsR family regulator
MDIFEVLAVPTRREIIELLAKRGTLSATQISDGFNMSSPAISQHLKVLREAHLVSVEKSGQQRMYQLDITGLYEFERWTHKMTHIWNERFDRLEQVLLAEKKKQHGHRTK